MTKKIIGKYRGGLLAFIVIFVVFLITANILLVSNQRHRLYDSAKKNLFNEIKLLGTLIREPLLRNDYDEVEQFLFQWGSEDSDILEITGEMPNKFVLAQYGNVKDEIKSYQVEHKVHYLKKDLMTIQVVKSFMPIDNIINTLRFQLMISSVILFILFGLVLWFTIKHLAIRPLEIEIEHRKQVEEELHTAKIDLENIVKDRTRELHHKNKELEQVIFATSHDLRSPLVNIDGYSRELVYSLNKIRDLLQSSEVPLKLKENMNDVFEGDISESLHYIKTSTYKMNALIGGMLKLSRAGKIDLKIEKVDMNEIINDVISNNMSKLTETGITAEVEKLPPCKGDKNSLNQVFSNLIDNAIKYTNPECAGIIKISGLSENNKSVYCVEDNGIGIPPEYCNIIFEIFQRLNPKESEGEGLGLTIVHKILSRLEGSIWTESKSGKGSKFFVSLPS